MSLHNVRYLGLRILQPRKFQAALWAHRHHVRRLPLATNYLRLQRVRALVALQGILKEIRPLLRTERIILYWPEVRN